VLTSGGAPTAREGVDVIAALVLQARARVSIIAGGGIREHNVREVIARTGVHEVHGRLVDEAQMRGMVNAVRRSG
jgi:copper homeostasis protein